LLLHKAFFLKILLKPIRQGQGNDRIILVGIEVILNFGYFLVKFSPESWIICKRTGCLIILNIWRPLKKNANVKSKAQAFT